MIEISNLTKKFKKLIAVNDLSLEINDNEVFALLGLNGAGKTTTINILCSLINKDSGKVIINNLDLDITKKEIKQIINVSPQETAICGNLTVYENLEIIAKLYGIENYQQKINAIIDKFYLKEKEKNLAKSLSGGQKKRLSIAMAVITEPKILVLDEPTLGLDIKVRKELWKLIEEYKKKTTIILTTHYLEEAVALADRIGIMNKGKLVSLGTEEEIIKKTNTSNFEDAFLSLAGGEDE